MTIAEDYEEADWQRLATLPSLTVDSIDLDIVDLCQRGLATPELRLTQRARERLGGANSFVLRDVEGTPLLLADVNGEAIATRTLRPVDPISKPASSADLGVVVKGVPSRADLARIEVLTHSDTRVLWLVLADRSREGRELVAQVEALASSQTRADHAIVRVPWPGDHDGELLCRPRTPSMAEVAAAFGALHHLSVGDGGAGRRSRLSDRGGTVVFFTGLSGSGKSTLAKALRDALEARTERPVNLLDGDDVRRMLSAGLGFGEKGRAANVRRVSWVASLLAGNGAIAITALIAPFADVRDEARAMASGSGADFLEVWVSTPMEECERRDRKGLYAMARAGQIPDFTGIDSPYQIPTSADLVIDTSTAKIAESVELIFAELGARAVRRGVGVLARELTSHLHRGATYEI